MVFSILSVLFCDQEKRTNCVKVDNTVGLFSFVLSMTDCSMGGSKTMHSVVSSQSIGFILSKMGFFHTDCGKIPNHAITDIR